MKETDIKTRLGLILQGVLRTALTSAGITFQEDYQYDSSCEIPDFLIPDAVHPKFVIETHQTDARDSFRMKTLRAFTAITEAKVFYSDDLVSINVLFGNPERELPPSNVKALCGFFDINIVPQYDVSNPQLIIDLEQECLKLASNEELNVKESVNLVIESHTNSVEEITSLVDRIINSHTSAAKAELFSLWQLERERIKKLEKEPEVKQKTYYKRAILKSLYISDGHFQEVLEQKDPNKYSEELKNQLVLTKIAESSKSLTGKTISLNSEFSQFICDPEAARLRKLCVNKLSEEPAMYCFFEDIKDISRRNRMAKYFYQLVNLGKSSLVNALVENLSNSSFMQIDHARTWIADFLPIVTEVSQNEFNRRMVNSKRDPENYQYPFNNITGKFERLMNCPEHFQKYSEYSAEIFYEICQEKNIDLQSLEENILATEILKLRLDGAVKLQRFNPLFEIILSIGENLGLKIEKSNQGSLIYDLAGGKGRLGKYSLILISSESKTILANAVAVHDNHGDDKSKEWGARRRATLYRYLDGQVQKSGFDDGLFVIDGEWKQKDINRLYASGWNYIVRLSELEDTLKKIFDIA